jgi:NIMA (never in mitosis gene a)-related kinase
MQDFIQVAKIGEGSFSSVLKVKRISDGQTYALKKVKMSGLK